VRHVNNNVPFLKQAKAGGTYSTLAQLNSADRWLISPDAEDVINQAAVHYSGASNTDYLFKADKTNRRLSIGVGNAADKGIVMNMPDGVGVTMGDGTTRT